MPGFRANAGILRLAQGGWGENDFHPVVYPDPRLEAYVHNGRQIPVVSGVTENTGEVAILLVDLLPFEQLGVYLGRVPLNRSYARAYQLSPFVRHHDVLGKH